MLQKSPLPNKYVHIKPQDWEDFETLYPDAAKMLAERSMYRHYLQARLDSWALDDPIARSHAETLAKELEPFVINPHSHLPIAPVLTATPPAKTGGIASRNSPPPEATPLMFPNDPDMEFLAGCTTSERLAILHAARQHFSLTGINPEMYTRLHAHLYKPLDIINGFVPDVELTDGERPAAEVNPYDHPIPTDKAEQPAVKENPSGEMMRAFAYFNENFRHTILDAARRQLHEDAKFSREAEWLRDELDQFLGDQSSEDE